MRSAVSELGVGQGEEQGDREAQQPVMTEGGEGGSKVEQRQVGEGNEWTKVEGRKRRKRRGTGEPGVPHTQGKRHVGAQNGTSADQPVSSTLTGESEGEWDERDMSVGRWERPNCLTAREVRWRSTP